MFRGNGDGRIFHAFFQHSDFAAVLGTSKLRLPCFPDTLRVLNSSGVFQYTGRCRTIGEELSSIFLGSDGKADGVFRHCNRAIADEPVKAEAGNVEYVGGLQNNRFTLAADFVYGTKILIVELAILVPVHTHLVGHQRIQGHDLALAVPDDLSIGIAPQEQVCHERFPEDEGTHLRIRLIMQNQVQRMVNSFFLAAVAVVSVNMKREPCDSFCQNTDAGVNRSHLHGTAFCYCFARGAAAHVKGVTGADCAVGGLVSGFE